jgi:hypothetical protein
LLQRCGRFQHSYQPGPQDIMAYVDAQFTAAGGLSGADAQRQVVPDSVQQQELVADTPPCGSPNAIQPLQPQAAPSFSLAPPVRRLIGAWFLSQPYSGSRTCQHQHVASCACMCPAGGGEITQAMRAAFVMEARRLGPGVQHREALDAGLRALHAELYGAVLPDMRRAPDACFYVT